MDKLRQRCEEMLKPGEDILLHAHAGGWIVDQGWIGHQLGWGRAFLTNLRIVWIQHRYPFRLPRSSWVSDVVEIPLHEIENMRVSRGFLDPWLLRMRVGGKESAFRLAKDLFLLWRNVRTAEEWRNAIEQLGSRPEGAEAVQVMPEAERATRFERRLKSVWILWILLIVLGIPIWVTGFILAGVPVTFFLVMAAITAVGLLAAFVMIAGITR